MSNIFESAPEQFSSGTQKTVKIFGARTRFWEYGNPDGATLVLIHGFRGDHHGLELIAGYLSDFRVIVPDLPGFGKSEALPAIKHSLSSFAGWLNTFTEKILPHQTFDLVGHSFGSIICSYFAASRPEKIKRLILINPISEPALEGNQKIMSYLAEAYYELGARLPQALGFPLLRSKIVTLISSKFMAKNSDPALQRFIDGQHLAYFGAFSSRTALLEAYQTSISETAAHFAPVLSIPTLMIVAECDDLGTLQTQQAMAQNISHCTLKIIPHVGHLIHYETPQTAAKLIRDFTGKN
ncbi:alpha/beta hydrolase [uncultured Rothia sp.]|uniref:alpha/beta fold hydrolase n=1 Tax=uncultured Rothia sp. TaxID=316088 RepID=UPI0032174BB0